MKTITVDISNSFKDKLSKTTYAILFFIVIYLLLLVFAVLLTIASIYAGIALIVAFPKFITLILGAGLASLGILVFVFLIKFLFKSHKTDISNLTEITRKEEPELFKILDELTKKVDTTFPKKVYLTPDVNAAVFYNSSFWSMFFPIKKNLMIGLGLINTVSKDELKAILSHEFGHFSQKSMKAGSYVYNVNQVIFNMLYENEGYGKFAQNLANTSAYIGIFVMLAMKIVEAIQWVLKKVYEIVNKNYLALSREMEFHADEIAANVTGFEPLKSSLLRMQLAEHALTTVMNFYSEQKVKSKNIYKDQFFVMNYLAKKDELKLKNELPIITIHDINKYNKSKLVIKNQWASHPSTEERIEHLEKTGLKSESDDFSLANELLFDSNTIQEKISETLFTLLETPTVLNSEEFKNEFIKVYSNNDFPKIYNGYYNDKNPIYFDINKVGEVHNKLAFNNLFSDDMVEEIYNAISLKNDIEVLKLIQSKEYKIKTFDYDGVKYKAKYSKDLLLKLEHELTDLNELIKQNDMRIFSFFKEKENVKQKNILTVKYHNFFEFDKGFDHKSTIYTDLINDLQFLQFNLPVEDIKENLKKIAKKEIDFKASIKEIINNNEFQSFLTENDKNAFELYLSRKWDYFGVTKYIDNNLEMLFDSLNRYVKILSKSYVKLKKDLLDYQVALLD